jgi:hypothetical protein
VNQGGRIEETRDGGNTWQPAAQGLDVPWADHMVERFAQVEDELVAVLSDGALFSRDFVRTDWRRLLPEITGCNSIFSA